MDIVAGRWPDRPLSMCGRFTQDIEEDDLDDLYELHSKPDGVQATFRWNGAPTQDFLICRTDPDGRRELAPHRWGLVPSWARDPKIGARMINARSETVDSKPSFRVAFRRRRCLVPARGWFEWQRVAGTKQPWWISLGGEPFSFAGLWEVWNRGAGPVHSFTILTCPSTGALEGIHHRQPAVVPRARYDEWLSPGPPTPGMLELVRAPNPGPFDLRRVSTAVNSPRNDNPDILRPL